MNTLRTLQIYMKNQNGKKMSRFFSIVLGTYADIAHTFYPSQSRMTALANATQSKLYYLRRIPSFQIENRTIRKVSLCRTPN